MSILNVHLALESAMVAVDTEVRDEEGAIGAPMNKMLPLPHVSGVIACRGQGAFFIVVAMTAAMPCRSIDELIDTMPHRIADAWKSYTSWPTYPKDERGLARVAGQEIIVVGWSPSKARMVGMTWIQDEPLRGFVAKEMQGGYRSPWADSLAGLPAPSSPDAMERLVRAQVALVRREAPGESAGGALVLAALTRNSISTMIAAEQL